MKKDPICKMEVREEEAFTAECDGVIYYFCSEGCKYKFLEEITCLPRTAYDLVIIGGGPAGLTASVYASTLNIAALLIARDLGGQAIDSTKIENYLGFDFITGPELIDKFKYQAIHAHYIHHLISEVKQIEGAQGEFRVITAENNQYQAKTLLIATGMTRRRIEVPGEERLQRKGIFYSILPNLAFVQGKDAAVIGGGNTALQMVENLHPVARNVYLICPGEMTGDPTVVQRVNRLKNLHKYEGFQVLEFAGHNTLDTVIIRHQMSGETVNLPVRGAFVAIGLTPNSQLVAHLVRLNDRGEIVINPDCSTSCPGIFSAGDVTNAFGKRIIIASGEGAKATLSVRKYLLELSKKAP